MFGRNSLRVAKIISGLSTLAFFLASLWYSYTTTFYAFIIYEVSVGMLYPSFSKLKSEYLDDKLRGTIMNIFKAPLNVSIVFLLINMNSMFTLKGLTILCFAGSFVTIISQMMFFNKEENVFQRLEEIKKQIESNSGKLDIDNSIKKIN